jgi:RNA polymerase sigma-70 factor (ECF subfamily)
MPDGANVTERSDAQLMAGVVAGDESALAELYDRHADAAFRLSYRLLGDRGLAEEVVQETMLAVWEKAEGYDPGIASLAAWLMTITRNRSIDRLRARSRRPGPLTLGAAGDPRDARGQTLDAAIEDGRLVAAAPAPLDPEALVDAAWLREAVRDALDGLPLPERRALELAYYEELTQSEIAARLGWPLGTVKTRTRRALYRLRTVLADALGPDLGASVAPLPAPETAASDVPGDADDAR